MKILKQIFVVAIFAGALFSIFRYLPLSTDAAAQRKVLARREIALRVLAEYLAGEFPGQKALIVSNPFAQQKNKPRIIAAFEEAGIRGLKKGWSGKVHLQGIGIPELDPAAMKHPTDLSIDRQTTTPLGYLTTAGAWDQLLRDHPGTDLVVSLIGLPATLRNLEIWQQAKPHFALLLPDLRMIGGAAEIAEAFSAGKLAAVILEKPGSPVESAPLARDYHVEFNHRFVLVTPKNFREILEGSRRSVLREAVQILAATQE